MKKKYIYANTNKCLNCKHYQPVSDCFPAGCCLSDKTYSVNPTIINKDNKCEYYEAKNNKNLEEIYNGK